MPGQKTTFKTKVALKTFGSAVIYFDFERTAETEYQLHNAKVEVLKNFINAHCFPAKQQLAFCSNNDSSISSNRGNYVELLHTLAAKDERLVRHLETTTVYSGFSNIIQNDLIPAIGDVVGYDIKEKSATPFVAPEVGESTYVTNKAQISRYYVA